MSELLIGERLSVKNCATLYAKASDIRAEQLENLCMEFALEHLTDVAKSKAFLDLPGSASQRLVLEAAKRGLFRN